MIRGAVLAVACLAFAAAASPVPHRQLRLIGLSSPLTAPANVTRGSATKNSSTDDLTAAKLARSLMLKDLTWMSGRFNRTAADKAYGAAGPNGSTAVENPKCDQACADGRIGTADREVCMEKCSELQGRICVAGFECSTGCGNHMTEKGMPFDAYCENLCGDVRGRICYPLLWEADQADVSPMHDDQPPPAVEATPPPRVYSGSFLFCNLYPASYDFEIMGLPSAQATDGQVLTTLKYEECDRISMDTQQVVGLKAKGQLAGVSYPIYKIPSIMVFGQWAHGNFQVNFNRYFAQGAGPTLCNGFPIWTKDNKDLGQEIHIFRGGYSGEPLTTLRYKQCMPTGLANGEVVAAKIQGNDAGVYRVVGSPAVVILGKAGRTTALAFEAWAVDGAKL